MIENKIVANKDLLVFNDYINQNNLRYEYGEKYSIHSNLWNKDDCYAKWAYCLMMFDKVKKSKVKVVDLGVGDGPVAHVISNQGYDVTGVDLTRVNHPFQSLVVMVLKDAVEFLKDYKDKTVDIFIDSCSVTHFNFTDQDNPGWDSVFKQVHRILKSGGYFIVSSDIRLENSQIGEFIMPETIVECALANGLKLTTDFDFSREDAIIRNEGHGEMGVANFCFIKK